MRDVSKSPPPLTPHASTLQRFNGSTIQRFHDSTIQRFNDSTIQRFMAKITKSQWDFGELFDPATTRRVLTVGELTATVRRLLEKEVGHIWVTGEVTNLREQGSGHIY